MAKRFDVVLLFVAVVVLAVSGSAVAALDGCFSAQVEAPFVLPDGSGHAPGELRVCMVDYANPATGLYVISVDGAPVGRYRARLDRVESGAESDTALLVFARREGARTLELQGVTEAGSGLVKVHDFSRRSREVMIRVLTDWDMAEASVPAADRSTLVAVLGD
ncbi:hypothetical protein ABI59_09550 [Acidobacteria bacterium Mor1]|nr:hypothetical protein ABI59_09550 [Acidobacteria bacterium Mor1]